MTALTLKELDALKLKIREYVPASGFLDDLLDMASLAREALQAREQKPVARILKWVGPELYSRPAATARTFAEFPVSETSKQDSYWQEGEPLYAAPQPQGKDSNHER